MVKPSIQMFRNVTKKLNPHQLKMKLMGRRKHKTYFVISVDQCENSLYVFLQTPGPLAEIAFWHERVSILSVLSEQLKQPVVKKILEVMNKADAGIVQTLKETVAELNKYRLEADDNTRYLNVLERHFMVNFFKKNFKKFLLSILCIDLLFSVLIMNSVTPKSW